jgi:hypothetical protein
MDNFKDRIYTFAAAPAPADALYGLPSPFPDSPKPIRGTNTEFIHRFMLEGLDILDNGDSQLKSFRFTEDDLISLYRSFQTLEKIILQNELPQNAREILRKAPQAGLALSTYYKDKNAALQQAIDAAQAKFPALTARFNTLVTQRNYPELLKLYPHFSGLVEMEQPEKMTLPSLTGKRQERKLLKCFQAEVEKCIAEGADIVSWLGCPEELRTLHNTLEICSPNIERNQRILTAATHILRTLSDTLEGRPALPKNVLWLPDRVMGGNA